MDFEFDCPKLFIDINVALLSGSNLHQSINSNDNVIDPWFEVYHPEHDIDYSINSLDPLVANDTVIVEKISDIKSAVSTRASKRKLGYESTTVTSVSKRGKENDLAKMNTESLADNVKRPVASYVAPSKPIYLKVHNVYKPVIASKEDMTKEIRAFNAKLKSDAKILNKTTKSANVDEIEEDEIEREIRLMNQAKEDTDASVLMATTKSFCFNSSSSCTCVGDSCTCTTSTRIHSNTKSISMAEKLEDFKMKKRSMAPTVSKRVPSRSSIGRFPPIPEVVSKDEILKKLKIHNGQFVTKSAIYEPSRHSVREVRAWEKSRGKLWANLTMEEREAANAEIQSRKISS